jgi:pyruvate/2-oxoglutarate dehydrogenase complex dihydrolipoamide acyltransferase (E2) component
MPHIPILMPQLGESIAEATVIRYLVQPGDSVQEDQDLIEVETSKAVMCVTAPCAGKIRDFRAKLDESYPVGATLGQIEVSAEAAAQKGLVATPPAQANGNHHAAPGGAALPVPSDRVAPTVRGLPVPAHAAGASYMSPRMKARMDELGLHAADLSGIAGSGTAGRVTIDDFERFLAGLEKLKLTPASTMRVAVADAMRRSWTRPIATVGLPARLDAMLAHRKVQNPKPGPALYALRALALALAENSAAAGRLVGHHIVHPSSIDIGFAVEAEDGVLVPVIRKADQMVLKDLTQRYDELVDLDRDRDELRLVRPHVGNPHPPAGANAGARARSRPQNANVGRGIKPLHSRHGGGADAEL